LAERSQNIQLFQDGSFAGRPGANHEIATASQKARKWMSDPASKSFELAGFGQDAVEAEASHAHYKK
jgi:hypothetical protein